MSELSDYQNGLLNDLASQNIDLWNPGDTVYDVLIRNNFPERAEMMQKAGLGDYRITDYVNNNYGGFFEPSTGSGFAAVAFTDPAGNAGISYRGTEFTAGGTEMMKDMISNYNTALNINDPQVREALEFFERNRDPNGRNYVYGTSKGGQLAAGVFAVYHMEIRGVSVFNAQPFNSLGLSREVMDAFRDGRFNAVVIAGDWVNMLGGDPPYPIRYVECDQEYYQENGWMSPHSIASMRVDENGNGIPCDNRFSGFRWQQAIGVTAIVVIGITQVVWDVSIWSDFNKLCEKLAEGFHDLTGGLRNAVGGVWDGAVNIAYNRFNDGHNYAQSRPVIKMDTHEMLNDAEKLKAINKDLDDLRERLDAFVKKITREDAHKTRYPVKMESKLPNVGKHRVIDRSWEYLERTAKDFETNERAIVAKAREVGL
jgi:hypothetical protein